MTPKEVPGIGISPIADMDAHQTIVTATLVAKSSGETPKNVCWEARSEACVVSDHLVSSSFAAARVARSCTRPGRSGSVTLGSSCQIHQSYGGVWG